MSSSRSRGIVGLLCALLSVFSSSDAHAQASSSERPLRLYVVPQIGVATEQSVGDRELLRWGPSESVSAWTLGAQVEMVGRSRWTPLVGYQRWWLEQTCDDEASCPRRSWSAEGGLVHSFLPTSIFRPYGGGVVGVQQFTSTRAYLQGRAGIDFAPVPSPVVLRMEVRYVEFFGVPTLRLFQLTSGIRIPLPAL